MPGHWAAPALLQSLDLELCREEERPSGFRKSLVCTQGSWGPARKQAGSDGPARPGGIVARRPQDSYGVSPILYSCPIWLPSQADLRPKTPGVVPC